MDNTQEKPEECYGCGWETEDLTFYPPRTKEHAYGKWLCSICASTFMGNAVDYPTQYRESKDSMQTTIYCTHLILEAISKIGR